MPEGYMNLGTLAAGEGPQGWDIGVVNRQGGRGHGATLHFRKPPSPDAVAPRGTPEWRAAWNAENTWIQQQLWSGATLADMGFDPHNRENFPIYQRLRTGQYSGMRPGYWEGAKGYGRGYYDFKTGQLSPAGGGGGAAAAFNPYAAKPVPPSQGGMSATAAPVAAAAPEYTGGSSYGAGASTIAPGGGVSASDVYNQNPRGRRKVNFGALLGG